MESRKKLAETRPQQSRHRDCRRGQSLSRGGSEVFGLALMGKLKSAAGRLPSWRLFPQFSKADALSASMGDTASSAPFGACS